MRNYSTLARIANYSRLSWSNDYLRGRNCQVGPTARLSTGYAHGLSWEYSTRGYATRLVGRLATGLASGPHAAVWAVLVPFEPGPARGRSAGKLGLTNIRGIPQL